MIKHHLKWKLPKQDVVQMTSEAKSTFYIARRLIQTKSDKSYKKIQIIEQPIEFAKITHATSRALTTSHYRSNSTTPSNFRAQQSKNFDELVQGFLTERQQSNSIISTDLISNKFQKPSRVVSLYQITSQNTQNMQDFPNIDQVIENGIVENSSEFHSFKRMRSTRSDFNKLTKTESEIFDQVPCNQVKLQPQRRSIFLHISYKDYKQKSKLQLKKNTQTNHKQSIFIQKVLKNIKDSQNEISETKKFVRKYSKIWNENFSQTQFSEQQKYSKSQSQFKLYFNSLIEKTLNKFRLYQQITDLLNLINQYKNEMYIQLESMHDLRRLYLQNHLMRPIFSEIIEDKQFRFEREIQSFEMIEILDQVQDEIKDFFTLSSSSFSEISEIKLQYFICQNIKYQTEYFITPIISTLDIMTKNKLLSVDYTDLDIQIYRSNVFEILPDIFSGNKIIQKLVAKKRYDMHFEILQGNFYNINQLEDIEHNNYYFIQKTQAQVQIDKKAMMHNLRKQTKDAKIQGRRSTLLMKSDFSKLHNQISKDDNIVTSTTLKVPKQYLSRRKSKSVQYINLKQQEIEETETSFALSDIQEIDLNSFKVKPVKYKQQLRLQNLMMFDHAIKKEFSAMAIVEMMIQHNLVDELIDFLRQNPNFSLNQRNVEGKPLILLASQSGNIDVVQYMVNQNVHLNVKDLDGNTPLHFAVAHRHYDVADLLLQNGANQFAKNRNNQNPWNWNMQLLQNQ